MAATDQRHIDQVRRSVSVAELFAVDSVRLWQVISDFAHIDAWTNVKVVSTTGTGIGDTRTIEMPSGQVVTERLFEFDVARQSLAYEVVEPNPYPMHAYRSTISLEAIANRQCRLHWRGEYAPLTGTDFHKTDALVQNIYQAGIKLLHAHLGACEHLECRSSLPTQR